MKLVGGMKNDLSCSKRRHGFPCNNSHFSRNETDCFWEIVGFALKAKRLVIRPFEKGAEAIHRKIERDIIFKIMLFFLAFIDGYIHTGSSAWF